MKTMGHESCIARPRSTLVGSSVAFRHAVARVDALGTSSATVLIEGESGTGKEGFACAIHSRSGRPGPLVAVNCGAIPTELFERELFGHKRAAFTGAVTSENGLVQAANRGTLFLDEIDALPPSAQAKLLRFLQEKEYRPLGSVTVYRADVRVIAASNRSLEEAVAGGQFRQDLYYRVAVLLLKLPPLRRRHGDVELLAEHFLELAASRGQVRKRLTVAGLDALRSHIWPGNVRELQHVIERAVAMSGQRPILDVDDIEITGTGLSPAPRTFKEAKERVVSAFERAYLEDLLAAHAGNIGRAARAASKNRRALWELLRKHAISAARFRESPEPSRL